MNFIKKIHLFIHPRTKNTPQIKRSVISIYHLSIILKGTFTYKVNGEEIVVEENDAILLIPETDRERTGSSEYVDYAIFNFIPTEDFPITTNIVFKNAVNQHIKNILNSYPYRFFDPAIISNYKWSGYKEDNTQEKDKANAIIHNIFNCILIDLFDSIKFSTKNQYVIDILKHINNNIKKPLTLHTVCKEIHLSEGYTARLFKREMGLTVNQYITQQKLNIAKEMILNDDSNLQTIAENLGFQSYNYFSRMFKKQFGTTPISIKMELKKASRNASL